MRIWRLTFIVLLNTAFLPVADSEQPRDYYRKENVGKFAEFLFEQGDYLRAAGEYQRFLFFQPRKGERIHYKIALCYRLGGKSEKAIQAFETLLQLYPHSELSSDAHYQIAVSYFLANQFLQSVKYLDAVLPRIADVQHRAESQELKGLSYLMQKKWLEADVVFEGLRQSDVAEVRKRATLYHNYAIQGTQLPNRSPFLAGILSTIIPGSGRLYTGRIGDALTSLLAVGLTSWQAYDGFRRDGFSSTKGWTLGALSGVFYVGNIYGSAISASVHNRHVEDEFLGTLSIKLSY